MNKQIRSYIQKMLCILLAIVICGAFLVYFSIRTCYGFYEIKQIEANDENYYIYVTDAGKLLRVSCNKMIYDMVEENKGGWFEVEFKYSSIFHNICYVTFLKFDEEMSKLKVWRRIVSNCLRISTSKFRLGNIIANATVFGTTSA